MREIKFRAWDTKYQWWDNETYIDLQGCVFEPPRFTYDTPNIEIENAEKGRFVLMQSTGLTDKNGNDAYEKDLIKLDNVFCSGDQHFYNGKFLIEFHDGSFVIKSLISNWKKSIISFHGLVFEVIGNIYENPELLGAK